MRCLHCPNEAERTVTRNGVTYLVCIDCAVGIDVLSLPEQPKSRSIKGLVEMVKRHQRTDRQWRRA